MKEPPPDAPVRRCRCGKAAVAGVLCPVCGFLPDVHDPPLGGAEESPEAVADRRRRLFWFWLLLGAGPVLGLAILGVAHAIQSGRLVGWKKIFIFPPGLVTFGILLASAMGATYFLIKSMDTRLSRLDGFVVSIVLVVALHLAGWLMLFFGKVSLQWLLT